MPTQSVKKHHVPIYRSRTDLGVLEFGQSALTPFRHLAIPSASSTSSSASTLRRSYPRPGPAAPPLAPPPKGLFPRVHSPQRSGSDLAYVVLGRPSDLVCIRVPSGRATKVVHGPARERERCDTARRSRAIPARRQCSCRSRRCLARSTGACSSAGGTAGNRCGVRGVSV